MRRGLRLDGLDESASDAAYADLIARLNAATDVDDLRMPPSNRLEALKGDRAGQHSIRINDQWRVCFRWQGEDAFDVKIVDYH